MRDFFPTGKFKNARIAPHNRRPKMAINKRRFSREATYARRCLRGRSCVRGRVVPCPAPQPGKVSGMGMQDRRPPRIRKKFPHQDSTLPTPGRAVCPVPCQEAAADPRSRQGDRKGRCRAGSVSPPPCQEAAAGPRSHQGDHRCLRRRAGSVCPTPYQEAAADPRSHRGDRRGLRRRAGSVCPPPYQEAAAGPRSHQGDHRGIRRRAGYFQCQEGL